MVPGIIGSIAIRNPRPQTMIVCRGCVDYWPIVELPSASRSFSRTRSCRLRGASTSTSGIHESTQRTSSLCPEVSSRISSEPSQRSRRIWLGCQTRSRM